MKTFDVYKPWNLAFVKASGTQLTDENGKSYIDFYGGHGVISIGHNHPSWKQAISERLDSVSYYSNAITIREQETLAEDLNRISGMENYRLSLCNSGAEANENAIKIASFKTGRSKVLAFKGAFHGRTAGALAITDNPAIQPAYGKQLKQDFIDLDDEEGLKLALETGDYAAVIVEGIQGVSGVFEPTKAVWQTLNEWCTKTGTLFIADEIQSGCGRTGDYFAFQHWGVKPDLITMAKGIGNGFPVAGVLVAPEIEPVKGQLGTTFGGSYLACAAMSSVLKELEKGDWITTAAEAGKVLKKQLSKLDCVEEVRGRGLMIGIQLSVKASAIQSALLEKGIVAGTSSCPYTLRLLPPLTVSQMETDQFLEVFAQVLQTVPKPVES